MSEHTDETIIRQLRETVVKMSGELAVLRFLVREFGRAGDGRPDPYIEGTSYRTDIWAVRNYNARKQAACPTSDT